MLIQIIKKDFKFRIFFRKILKQPIAGSLFLALSEPRAANCWTFEHKS
jgi:hypothetical protein